MASSSLQGVPRSIRATLAGGSAVLTVFAASNASAQTTSSGISLDTAPTPVTDTLTFGTPTMPQVGSPPLNNTQGALTGTNGAYFVNPNLALPNVNAAAQPGINLLAPLLNSPQISNAQQTSLGQSSSALAPFRYNANLQNSLFNFLPLLPTRTQFVVLDVLVAKKVVDKASELFDPYNPKVKGSGSYHTYFDPKTKTYTLLPVNENTDDSKPTIKEIQYRTDGSISEAVQVKGEYFRVAIDNTGYVKKTNYVLASIRYVGVTKKDQPLPSADEIVAHAAPGFDLAHRTAQAFAGKKNVLPANYIYSQPYGVIDQVNEKDLPAARLAVDDEWKEMSASHPYQVAPPPEPNIFVKAGLTVGHSVAVVGRGVEHGLATAAHKIGGFFNHHHTKTTDTGNPPAVMMPTQQITPFETVALATPAAKDYGDLRGAPPEIIITPAAGNGAADAHPVLLAQANAPALPAPNTALATAHDHSKAVNPPNVVLAAFNFPVPTTKPAATPAVGLQPAVLKGALGEPVNPRIAAISNGTQHNHPFLHFIKAKVHELHQEFEIATNGVASLFHTSRLASEQPHNGSGTPLESLVLVPAFNRRRDGGIMALLPGLSNGYPSRQRNGWENVRPTSLQTSLKNTASQIALLAQSPVVRIGLGLAASIGISIGFGLAASALTLPAVALAATGLVAGFAGSYAFHLVNVGMRDGFNKKLFKQAGREMLHNKDGKLAWGRIAFIGGLGALAGGIGAFAHAHSAVNAVNNLHHGAANLAPAASSATTAVHQSAASVIHGATPIDSVQHLKDMLGSTNLSGQDAVEAHRALAALNAHSHGLNHIRNLVQSLSHAHSHAARALGEQFNQAATEVIQKQGWHGTIADIITKQQSWVHHLAVKLG